MIERVDARTLSEDDLDRVQGAGVFQTPAGGWGSDARAERSFQALGNVMKVRHDTASDDDSFSGQVGGSPDV